MRYSPLLRLAGSLLALCTSLSANAASYTLVDLGQLKFPEAINDHGEVAATSRNARAIVWRDGHWHRLFDRLSRARAINQHGDLAGDIGANPMLWQRGKEGRKLPLPGDSTFGVGAGINDARAVVGLFEAQDATIRCFQWTEEGGSIDLGFMGAGNFCQPFAINDAGQITGEATLGAERLPHAFIYSEGVFHDLGLLPDGDRSQGVAINGRGDVAGRATAAPSGDMQFHAALWPAGGEAIDLDPHGKYVTSIATGINDDGEVVGTVTLDAKGRQRAVRFHGHRAVLLQSEVVNLDGWTLEQAGDVNAHGEIVGVGKAPDGKPHAFLLKPVTTRQ